MPVVAIIGGQWGDEAKGKIVDLLAEGARAVVRFSGGANAGHTVVSERGEFIMHLVPSGIFYPGTLNFIGAGVVVSPPVLLREIDILKQRGIRVDNLFLSDRAHVIMPYHLLIEGAEEQARGPDAIGTTRRGIGPCIADKAARLGIRVGDLLDKEELLKQLRLILRLKNEVLTKVYQVAPLILEEVYEEYLQYGTILEPYIRETTTVINEVIDKGELVLLEGAQGTLLDPEFGTYPFVTSSSPTTAGACLGAGIAPGKLNGAVGVFKAYSTRVGAGPFPTELTDKTGDAIREKAKEYGATTGRPRRCGWFDGVAARFSTQLNGYTSIALTHLDTLDDFATIKVCTGYRARGKLLEYMPSSSSVLRDCQPVYEELTGWQTSTQEVRSFDDLPPKAQQYVRRIEELCGAPASIISVGPARDQTIMVRPLY